MLELIKLIVVIGISVRASFSDINSGKVYNREVLLGCLVALLLLGAEWLLIGKDFDFVGRGTFVVLVFLIAIALYALKVWGAGDAKLLMLFALLLPGNADASPWRMGFLFLFVIFLLSFVVLFMESIILWRRNKAEFDFGVKESGFSANAFVSNYVLNYAVIACLNYVLSLVGVASSGLTAALNIGVVLLISSLRVRLSRLWVLVCLMGCILFSVLNFALPQFVIVLVVLLVRAFANRYNYQRLSVEALKPGHVLAISSVLRMSSSRIKGLPQTTSETIKDRLTQEEVDSIRRWSVTAKGQPEIIIVRILPFAPFISVGAIGMFIYQFVLG